MENKIINETLKLEGVTCVNCETKIKKELMKLKGVIEVKVSYVTSTVDIRYNAEMIKKANIIKTIEKLDYKVKENTVGIKQVDEKNSMSQFIVFGIIILGAYMIIRHTVGFNFIPEISPGMGYGVLFAIGMLTSIHCVAMCGGINLSVCVSNKFDQNQSTKLAKLLPSLLYNGGRVLSYTVIGGIVGALGSVFSISNTGKAGISIIAGVFMVIMGLNLLNVFPWLRKLNPRMPKLFAGKINSRKKNKGPFVVGMLNGLMPCGPLQAMQLYALGTGSFITGAFSMFLFSLGTVPLLFAFGAMGSLLSAKFTKNMIKASAVLVIFLGFAMFNRGAAFAGINLSPSTYTADSNTVNAAAVNGEVQEITTTLESGKYTPITVQAGIPVKWTIIADESNLNGCNNEIIIPQYNIQQKLSAGENIISFTPTESGKFGYSCWMGMIRSYIDVTAQDATAISEETKSASAQAPQATDIPENSGAVDESGLPAGCCAN